MLTKTCTRCGETYAATTDNFYAKSNGKYRLESECKLCKRLRRINEYNKKVGKNLIGLSDLKSNKKKDIGINVKSNCRYAVDRQLKVIYLSARGVIFQLPESLLNEMMYKLNHNGE